MRIACGSSAENELKTFILFKYNEIADQWSLQGDTDLDLQFFLNGVKSFSSTIIG